MKQLKSTSADLRSLFEDSITVKYVAEPLKSVLATQSAPVVRQWMESLNFDVLGVEDNGIICGYIDRQSLADGLCGDYQRIFHPSELIAASTPLIELLRILRYKTKVFVLDRDRVSGIVTRGDLQKAPVRMLLFGLVTLLEMQILRLVRIYYPNDSWQPFVKSDRVALAKKLWHDRQAKNEAMNLTDYLQFSDKRELILAKTEIVDRLGLKSKRAGERFLKSAEALRNKLAHAQDLVNDSSWPELIELAAEIETLLQRCEEIESDDMI
ncbi:MULTISPECIES: CBS domain-containing protein [Aerosakkonema]|uniref:CBS domain-containing protein n=1 Tax=Aerosakkonema TaxID=1246629 RepID=UPI0035B86796